MGTLANYNVQKEKSINKKKKISVIYEEEKLPIHGYSTFQYVLKRLIDYILVCVFILFLWPVVFYSVYRIKKESPGSIFYKQSRIGINGKPFTCYKFRSMHENSHFGVYTEDNDSRIFSFGHTMRKLRIDELAQIINVIRGDMHIVGPRAEWDILVKEYEQKIKNYNIRSKVRPGITGLAQVRYPYGRNLYDTKQKLKFDRAYIQNWSLFLEIQVLLETVLVVLKKQGV